MEQCADTQPAEDASPGAFPREFAGVLGPSGRSSENRGTDRLSVTPSPSAGNIRILRPILQILALIPRWFLLEESAAYHPLFTFATLHLFFMYLMVNDLVYVEPKLGVSDFLRASTVFTRIDRLC